MAEKRKISFKEYSEGIEKLAIMIDESGFKASHIISIARGGLRVGDILSRLLRVRSSYLGVESYEVAEKGKVSDNQKDEVIFSRDISSTTLNYGTNVLICDDLVDSGKSLIYTKQFLLNYEAFKGKNINFKTAVLYQKPASKITPDYVVHKMTANDWLVFFYEESELISISDLKKKYNA
jgi:hypoxanthine phosphoribosyltransferase